jgi:hypothetical protein
VGSIPRLLVKTKLGNSGGNVGIELNEPMEVTRICFGTRVPNGAKMEFDCDSNLVQMQFEFD